MTSRVQTVWLSSILLCSCTLDSTPRAGSDSESAADRRGPGWKPAGSSTSLDSQRASSSIDSGDPVEPAQSPASGSTQAHDAGSGGAGASDQDPPSAGAIKKNPKPNPSADAGPGAADAPAADGGIAQPADRGDPAAGGGGMFGQPENDNHSDSAGANGANGANGAGGSGGAAAESIRQRFIDAAIDALGGGDQEGGNQDGGIPWRRSGSSAGGLSPDFVLPVLRTMRHSAICFRDVRRCVEMCLVLSTDCKPCASDPECGAALKDVCGPTIGNCGTP